MRRRLRMGTALRVRVLLVAALVTAAALLAGVVSADGAQEASAPKRDAGDRRVVRELELLADAWAEGGGTYGYPFWAKAQERWRAGTISASVLREYTSGYRDSLQIGCDLVDAVDVETDVAKDVREMLVDACGARVDALRAQQQQLDRVIERRAAQAGEFDADELAELDKDVATRAETVAQRLQESYRGTREAMELAQAELDAGGFERLREDAFI